jgi:HAE1 family hydrophobic/amphiphilic exporter-1
VDEVMARAPGIRFYTDMAGYSFFTRSAAPYVGTGFVAFEPWEKRAGLDAAGIIASLNVGLSRIPGARAFALAPPAIPGISAAGGFSLMLQDRSGGSVDFLAQNVQRFVAEARKRPELQNINVNSSPAVPQLFADVDKEKAMKQGVAVSDVYGTLQAFLGGSYVNDFSRFGRQWKVYVQAEPEYRRGPDDLRQFYVRNAHGDMVPLSSFVIIRNAVGPEYTVRFNLYRSTEIIGTAAPGYSSGQALAALEEVAAQVLPSEMGYAWNALSYQEKTAQGGTARVLGLSIVFVFLILAALFAHPRRWTRRGSRPEAEGTPRLPPAARAPAKARAPRARGPAIPGPIRRRPPWARSPEPAAHAPGRHGPRRAGHATPWRAAEPPRKPPRMPQRSR